MQAKRLSNGTIVFKRDDGSIYVKRADGTMLEAPQNAKPLSTFETITSPLKNYSPPQSDISSPENLVLTQGGLTLPLPSKFTPAGLALLPYTQEQRLKNAGEQVNTAVQGSIGNLVESAGRLSPKLPSVLQTPYENTIAGIGALGQGLAEGMKLTPKSMAQSVGSTAALEGPIYNVGVLPLARGIKNLATGELPTQLANATLPAEAINTQRALKGMPSVGEEALNRPYVGNTPQELTNNSKTVLKNIESQVQQEVKNFRNVLSGELKTKGANVQGTPQLEYNPSPQEPITPYQSNRDYLIQNEAENSVPGVTTHLRAGPGYEYAEPKVGTIGSGVPELTGMQTKGKLFTKGSSKGTFTPGNPAEEQAIRQANIKENVDIMRDMANNAEEHSQPALEQILDAGRNSGGRLKNVVEGSEEAINKVVDYIGKKWDKKVNMEGLLELKRSLDAERSAASFKAPVTQTSADVPRMEAFQAMADKARELIGTLSPKLDGYMKEEQALLDIMRSSAPQVHKSIFNRSLLSIPMNTLRKSLAPARFLKGAGEIIGEGNPSVKTALSSQYITPYKKESNAP